MHTTKKYKNLVYYLEACESGSMFTSLPKNTHVYALSASSPDESSWGTYCSPDDMVNGVEIGSCLGDLFAVSWMEDSDLADFTVETLDEQFANVKKLVTMSQVMQWGDMTFKTDVIGKYLGPGKKSGFLDNVRSKWSNDEAKTLSSVDSRYIKLNFLLNKFKKSPSQDNYETLSREINQIKYFTDKFSTLKSTLNLTGNNNGVTNYDCYKKAVTKFEQSCGKVNEFALKYFKYLAEICEHTNGFGMEHVYNTITSICSNAY